MNACCEVPENRQTELSYDGTLVVQKYERCVVCGARHYTLSIDPVTLGLTGTDTEGVSR